MAPQLPSPGRGPIIAGLLLIAIGIANALILAHLLGALPSPPSLPLRSNATDALSSFARALALAARLCPDLYRLLARLAALLLLLLAAAVPLSIGRGRYR